MDRFFKLTQKLKIVVSSFPLTALASGLAPGVHPRLICTAKDLPAIRQLAMTELGQRILLQARWLSQQPAFLKALEKKEPEWLEAQKKESVVGWGKFAPACRNAALIYLVTGEEKDGQIAAEYFRIWLSAWPPDEEIQPVQSWGTAEYALAYDWIYDRLTLAERNRAEKIFASMLGQPTVEMFKTAWWLGGPRASGRNTTNWTPIFVSNLGLTNLVLEGRPGYNPEIQRMCVKYMEAFLNEGITADGCMFEGTGYALGFGTNHTPYFLAAMKLRGNTDLIEKTHLRQVPFWTAYDLFPWGFEGTPVNQTSGNYGPGSLTMFLAKMFGGLANWLYLNSIDEKHSIGVPDMISLFVGFPEPGSEKPDSLPLSHWFSPVGLVYCRSGWGKREAHFTFVTNSSLGAGHSHADQGSFCLAANGAFLVADPGVTFFRSEEHNVVHIDGLGQPQHQGGVEGFIRWVESNEYGEIIDADLTLSYSRFLSGGIDGPWIFKEYNPVERADRRALFIRGVTGPLLVIADDFRKDEKERTYDWRLHTVPNNILKVKGRTFRIEERFGGKFLHTLEPKRISSLVARHIPNGTYRGWLLVRSEPSIAAWASNNIRVNKKLAPYNTAYFGRGFFLRGWSWLPILPEKKAEIEITSNNLEVQLESVSGGRIALAVFTQEKDWQPGDEIPSEEKFIVLKEEDAVHSETPWQIDTCPKGVLDGLFLGSEPELKVGISKITGYRRLQAFKKGTEAQFLVVMVPHDEGDGRILEEREEGKVAVVSSSEGQDFVTGNFGGQVMAGSLFTDGRAGVVSVRNGQGIKGYALAWGQSLVREGMPLVRATQPVTVINDGTTLVVRGQGGSQVTCLRLGARKMLANGQEQALEKKEFVLVNIPKLPERWKIKMEDGARVVRITGDGPLPLKIKAPQAIRAIVNGVDRYFVRDRQGYIYPLLEAGGPFRFEHQQKAFELERFLVSRAKTRLVDGGLYAPSWKKISLLHSGTGNMELALPTFGPANYRLVLGLASEKTISLQVFFDNQLAAEIPVEPGKLRRLTLPETVIRTNPVRLFLKGDPNWALGYLELRPAYRVLSANLWRTIGPFPSFFLTRGTSDAEVKDSLNQIFPPEKELNFEAVYSGAEGKPIRWQHTDNIEVPRMKEGVDFLITSGVKKGEICYAVTFIKSPENREARLLVGCDFWANVYLNGQLVESERAREHFASDGAWFKAEAPIAARIFLKKGVNTLLVKCQGGSGNNYFTASITDPGDLEISTRR
ncbi:MAG: heparinase II/III-family protein [Candidatus Omnitrophica bacterium]|nr:heparinase II/III-family protein [Candidatus Omnitrophota bacterium]